MEADLKLARYAPGDYACKCIDCGSTFAGDKRATRYKSCATMVTRIAELEAALRELLDSSISDVRGHGWYWVLGCLQRVTRLAVARAGGAGNRRERTRCD